MNTKEMNQYPNCGCKRFTIEVNSYNPFPEYDMGYIEYEVEKCCNCGYYEPNGIEYERN